MFDCRISLWKILRFNVLMTTFLNLTSATIMMTSEDAPPTKVPYPFAVQYGKWPFELQDPTTMRSKTEHMINGFFNSCLSELSYDDIRRKELLTVKHKWISFTLMPCFDRAREILTKYCVNWTTNDHVKKFAYMLVNFCNAVWISDAAIETCMKNACEDKKIIEN